jgi:hypothetical protein
VAAKKPFYAKSKMYPFKNLKIAPTMNECQSFEASFNLENSKWTILSGNAIRFSER